MRNHLFIIFHLFLLSVTCCYAQTIPICGKWNLIYWNPYAHFCDNVEHGNWTLVFEDNFDGNTINTSNWFTCPDGWHRDHGNELQYYKDENIILSDGILHLTAKREPGLYTIYKMDEFGNMCSQQQYFEYTSGWIQTKAQFQHGLFEIRCKIPSGQGFWPAFWFYGNEGEIDVFEYMGDYPHTPYMTIHKWPNNGQHTQCSSHQTFNEDFSEDYHVFSLEWDEFKLIYRIDNEIVRIDYRYIYNNFNNLAYLYDCSQLVSGFYSRNPYFPENSQTLRLNFAISSNTCGLNGAHAPNSQTVFPSSFDIDYVRIYKKNNPNSTIQKCNFQNIESNVLTADTIIFSNGCETDLSTNKAAIAKANKEIILKSGFHAESGSTFHAFISNPSNAATTQATPIYDNNTEDYMEQKKCLQKKHREPSVLLYPSPNNGNFQLNIEVFAEGEDVDLEIRDIYGKTIYLQRISGSIVPISVDCPSGQYFAILKCGGNTVVEKFVVIK